MNNEYDDSAYNQYSQSGNSYENENSSDRGTFHPIGYRGYSANSLVTFNSFIQETREERSLYVSDVIFITFREGIRANGKTKYDKHSETKIKLNALELRAFAYGVYYGLKSSKNFDNKAIIHKINTASAEVQFVKEGDIFYLNCIKYSSKKRIGVSFDKFSLLSLTDTMKNLADLTENSLYKYQRSLKSIGV